VKLTKVRVQNFRSIEDSEPFEISDLTCLVGKNEAGKTAILTALQSIRPFGKAQTAFALTKDYPRRFVTRFESRHKDTPAEVVRTWWKLEEPELAILRNEFGDESITRDELEIVKSYNCKGTTWDTPISHPKAIQTLMDRAGLTAAERKKFKMTHWSPYLATEIEKLAEKTVKEAELLKLISAYRDKNVGVGAIDLLDPFVPRFFYVSHYDRMNGQISVSKLIADQKKDEVTSGDKIFLDFLKLAGTSLDDLQEATEYEDLKAKCEAASNDITEQIFKYWTQNDSLEVNLDFAEAKSDDPAPFDSGTVVHARVWNVLHRASVPFSERSAGFVWFFSFLVQFAAMREQAGNVIILLDEPGLTLHGKAQADLLRYINVELLPHHQVLLTTHSPFMVPADNFASVRVVEDVIDRSSARPVVRGTKVRSDVLATDPDTLFPLQGALGYDLAQSLFVGKNTLLVEGPSDILYLQALSAALKRRKREGLDSRWVICPTGGLDKVRSFVSLFGGNKLNVAVLTDLAKSDRKKIEDLKRSAILSSDNIHTYAEFVGHEEADVEDLFTPAIFAQIVNGAYSLAKCYQITPAKLSSAGENIVRQVKQVEAIFAVMPQTIPEYDHFTPASWLIANSAMLDGDGEELSITLDRAEAAFRLYNKLLI
jgi:predicted ATPase